MPTTKHYLRQSPDAGVYEWGFPVEALPGVLAVLELGVSAWWFDGDREELSRRYLIREEARGNEQRHSRWELHDYFVPYRELSRKELLAHRWQVSRERRSLPYQAGRALAAFERGMHLYIEEKQAPQAVAGSRRTEQRQIVIYDVVNPEPNPDAMAKVIIWMVREQLRKQQDHHEDERSRP